jgi:hypothetical protein
MSEYSLDGLVSQFAVVLMAMTESEALLLDRVRQVRFNAQNSPAVAGVSRPSMPFPADPAASVRLEPAPTPSEVAAAAPEAGPVGQPEFSQTEPGAPATGHRNYDYFSELDEKLTGLRQRYLE